jgi:hypothetical protein
MAPPPVTASSRGKKKASNKSASAPTSTATEEPVAATKEEESGSRKRAQRPATSAEVAPLCRPARKARTSSQAILPTAVALAGILIDGEPAASVPAAALLPQEVSTVELGTPVRGKPVSGRIQKKTMEQRHSAIFYKPPCHQKSWEEKVQERLETKAWKDNMD